MRDAPRWLDSALCDALAIVTAPLRRGYQIEVLGILVSDSDGLITHAIPVPAAFIEGATDEYVAFRVEGVAQFVRTYVLPIGRYAGMFHSHIAGIGSWKSYMEVYRPAKNDIENAKEVRQAVAAFSGLGPAVWEVVFAVNAYPFGVARTMWRTKDGLPKAKVSRIVDCGGLWMCGRSTLFEIQPPRKLWDRFRLFFIFSEPWSLEFAITLREESV